MENENNLSPDPRDQKRYYFHETRTRRATVAMLKAFAFFVMKIESHGIENLPTEGAVVLASNHVTNFDIFPMQLGISRPIFFMAKEELMRNPIVEYVLRKGGVFPVYRGTKDVWAKRHSEMVLEHGRVLGLFPEGTRSKGRGLRTAKTGTARFALKANCPIVPMAISGSQRMFKDFPKRTTVSVTLGEPIYPQPNEGPLALTDRLMFAIADLLPPELRGVYGEKPPGYNV
ncbi:MAG: 1-acyl-sn-glycerol-3-phosphate acyltransferase [Anaerolineales bacterium]|nr:1-acyl-sn-glycerol-3-phosphate acyltransferase [Chloroflexota bacterium]MBL6980317.1 1-acyl-sn-glycerol-3-phosphate acyltransferase [Anaerolineales bacterium]